MVKVSVIIPVYGVEKYIKRCAESLFMQTLEDIEYIFIDDCSKDKSMDILHLIIEENRSRITRMNWTVRTERMPTNSGLAAVRRHGIQMANGQYVIHCDSDDWVAPKMYKALYEKAKETGADIVISDFFTSDGSNHKAIKGCLSLDRCTLMKDLLTMHVSWATWNKLVKTDLYHDDTLIYPKDNMGEDMALIMQLIFKTKKISYVPEPLYYYYLNLQSITQVFDENSQYSKYKQLNANTNIIINFLKKEHLNNDYKLCIDYLKFNVKRPLWSLVGDPRYRSTWMSIYPEINFRILFNHYVPIKERIRYILTNMRLYPINVQNWFKIC